MLDESLINTLFRFYANFMLIESITTRQINCNTITPTNFLITLQLQVLVLKNPKYNCNYTHWEV